MGGNRVSTAKDFKREQIDAIKSSIENAKSIVMVEYKGISVAQDTKLRSDFRNADVEYKVLKNRLVKIAFNELGINDFDSYLENTTALAFAHSDPMSAAKVVVDNSVEIKCLKVKCGMLDGKFIDDATVKAIASIPSKEVLLAQLCGLLQSGLSGLARALSEVAKNKAE